jgi:hypothetical protein
MSIRSEIKARLLEGRLKRFKAVLPTVWEVREIYLTAEVIEAVGGVGAVDYEERLFGLAQARLEQFINGDEFVCRMPPSRKATKVVGIAMLEPVADEVWEFRIDKLRIFGRFAEKDVFVATNWGLRQLLDDDKDKWRFVIQTSRAEWKKLFPAFDPHRGSSLHDYISNARDIVGD